MRTCAAFMAVIRRAEVIRLSAARDEGSKRGETLSW
jgi:hypothetical protein